MKTAFTDADSRYMHRALQLAACGLGRVSPNPMVGAVIVAPDGHIIGEGFHRIFGGPHAEVNAVNSVSPSDKHLLSRSTIYVTLEPCSHFGKTPPCAVLLKTCGFKRVVVGAVDPFHKVSGKGLGILREAGIEVNVGVLEQECMSLNARFFTAHTLCRPFVTLKWAQSKDGYMDARFDGKDSPFRFSDNTGQTLVHRLRAHHDAIGVGSGTYLADSPRLDVRHWHGKNPYKVIFDRSGRCGKPTVGLAEELRHLYEEGITSILIEGGPTLLKSFIEDGLWDLARIEVAPVELKECGKAKSPCVDSLPFATRALENNSILYFSNNRLVNEFFVENGL